MWYLVLIVAIESATNILVKEKVFEWYRNLVEDWPVLGYSSRCAICTSVQVGLVLSALFLLFPAVGTKIVLLGLAGARAANIFHDIRDYLELRVLNYKLDKTIYGELTKLHIRPD